MIAWELMLPGGQVVRGEGQDAPEGMKLADLAREAIASRWTHTKAGTVIYAAGPVAITWTVQNIYALGPKGAEFMVTKGVMPHTKALSLVPACETCKVFLMPDGTIGVGRRVEEVGLAWQAFNTVKG